MLRYGNQDVRKGPTTIQYEESSGISSTPIVYQAPSPGGPVQILEVPGSPAPSHQESPPHPGPESSTNSRTQVQQEIKNFNLQNIAAKKNEISAAIESIYQKVIQEEEKERLGPASAQRNIQIEEVPANLSLKSILQTYANRAHQSDSLLDRHRGYARLLTKLTTKPTEGAAYQLQNDARAAFRDGKILFRVRN